MQAQTGLFEQGRGAFKKLTGTFAPSSSPPKLYNRASARLADIYGHESEGEEGDVTPRCHSIVKETFFGHLSVISPVLFAFSFVKSSGFVKTLHLNERQNCPEAKSQAHASLVIGILDTVVCVCAWVFSFWSAVHFKHTANMECGVQKFV